MHGLCQCFRPVMCESGFGFESRFKTFGAGFGFRPKNMNPDSDLRKKVMDSSTDSNQWDSDSDSKQKGWIRIQCKRCGFGFGFEVPGFAHHYFKHFPGTGLSGQNDHKRT